jgi:tetratricopeptide (TPR) repeat protein
LGDIREGKFRKLLFLAKDLASQRSDKGLDKAADILLQIIDKGCEDPEILVCAATYLLQGSRTSDYSIKYKAVTLTDKAVAAAQNNIAILERAIQCYELALKDFPEKINEIIHLSLVILNEDPDHVESMITLAYHREHPSVTLSIEDAIRMLEWAKEVKPGNVFVDFALARLYAEAGKFGAAKKLYKQVAETSKPGSQDSVKAHLQMKSIRDKSRQKKHRQYGVN